MKPTQLHTCTAPSSSLLSFLRAQARDAFESPASPRTSLKSPRCSLLSTNTRHVHVERNIGNSDGRNRKAAWNGLVNPTSPSKPPCRRASFQHAPYNVIASQRSACSRYASLLEGPLIHRRAFSASSLIQRWRLSFRPKKAKPTVAPLPSLLEDANAINGFGRSPRPANELKLRCTELDEQGNVTMISGEFKKSELIAKVGERLSGQRCWHENNTDSIPVRPFTPRPPQGRLITPPAHPRPPLRHPNQPPAPPSPHKTQPCSALRHIRDHAIILAVELHV